MSRVFSLWVYKSRRPSSFFCADLLCRCQVAPWIVSESFFFESDKLGTLESRPKGFVFLAFEHKIVCIQERMTTEDLATISALHPWFHLFWNGGEYA